MMKQAMFKEIPSVYAIELLTHNAYVVSFDSRKCLCGRAAISTIDSTVPSPPKGERGGTTLVSAPFPPSLEGSRVEGARERDFL